MATYADQSDYVLQSLSDRANTAETLLNITTTLIDQARQGITDMIAAYSALGVTVSVSGVDTTYVAPTATPASLPSTADVTVAVTPVDVTFVPATAAAPSAIPSTITISVTGVDTTYVPPSDTFPTIPDADDVAIGDAEWDRIFARAAAKELRASVAEEQAANSEASLRGMAIPGVISNGMLSKQQQRAMDRVSGVAWASSTEQAKAAREDIIKLTEMAIGGWVSKWKGIVESELARLQYENLELKKQLDPAVAAGSYAKDAGAVNLELFSQQWKTKTEAELARMQFNTLGLKQQLDPKVQTADNLIKLGQVGVANYGALMQSGIASEEARLKYEALELDKNLKPEALRAEYDLKITELAQANAVAQLVDLIQVYAQLTNALYSASDTSLSAGTSFGISGPFKYNPDAGEVTWWPTQTSEGGGGIF